MPFEAEFARSMSIRPARARRRRWLPMRTPCMASTAPPPPSLYAPFLAISCLAPSLAASVLAWVVSAHGPRRPTWRHRSSTGRCRSEGRQWWASASLLPGDHAPSMAPHLKFHVTAPNMAPHLKFLVTAWPLPRLLQERPLGLAGRRRSHSATRHLFREIVHSRLKLRFLTYI